MANYHVADGRIQSYAVFFDQQAVFEQLGLTE
jgi:ketosteroid isomerase-like protein